MTGDRMPLPADSLARSVSRRLLGSALVLAGASHLSWQREEFQAQVPSWFPADEDTVVIVSGVAELALGVALIAANERQRVPVGWLSAAFFVVIFPGNIAQFVEGTDAFGLDTDQARAARLAFQPGLVGLALWSTGAWSAWRSRRSSAIDG
jgi:uncharacterized membrane protein